jgi:ketosteroid isomerase-like protein
MDEQDRLAGATAAFVDALERGDAAAVSAVYASDARLLPPTAEAMSGREAIERFWRTAIEIGISHVEFEPLALTRHDGVAYETGRYVLRFESREDGSLIDRGKYVLVHERQTDGSWLRAVEMFNPDVPHVAREHSERREER